MNPNALTLSQLLQRIDELQSFEGKVESEVITKRLELLKSHYERRTKAEFNKGVVNPVPPDKIDVENPFVITPVSPAVYDRKADTWEKSLE